MKNFLNLIPLFKDLRNYSKSSFSKDLVAGLTVGVMLVPQGMAYAYLAGMPPIYGLYAGLIPLITYGVFGSSRHLSVGPVAVSALLVFAGIKTMAEPLTNEFIELAVLAAFLIGILQISLSALRLGILVNFISHPVISGFTSAAAIIVAVSQLKDVLGIDVPRLGNPLNTIWYILENMSSFNGYTVSLSLLALASLILIKRVNRRIPGSLIIVVVATALSWRFDFDSMGIATVGTIPEGLPKLSIPLFHKETVVALLPTVFTVTAISLVESLGIAKTYEGKSKKYKVLNNQELFALGAANVFGSFSQSMPTSGSFSRSAVNFSSNAKTGISSLVSALIVLFSLLFLTSLFRHLPIAILAAIILIAIKNLFDLHEAIRLWKIHRRDFYLLLITFLGTLLLGIELGVLLGFSLSIIMVLYKSSKPNITELGLIKGTNYFRSSDRYEGLVKVENHTLIRFDDQLYYGNAYYFKDKFMECAERNKSKYVVLDASNIHDIDSTGLTVLQDLILFLEQSNREFKIANMVEQVEDLVENSGILFTNQNTVETFGSLKEAVASMHSS